MKIYKILSLVTSLLFAYLFFQLFFDSESFIKDIGLQPSTTTSILARRASIFMLGLAVLLFCSRNQPHTPLRQFICLSTGITLIGLACMGSFEFIRGTVNFSILQAIVIETSLGLSFLVILLINRRKFVIQ